MTKTVNFKEWYNSERDPNICYFIKIDQHATIPEYKTEKSACCDIWCLFGDEILVKSREVQLVRTGLIAIPPTNYHWHIYLRSSTAKKYPGIVLANHVGIIDEDYIGPKDELKIMLYNTNYNDIYITPGERIAQMRLVKNEKRIIEEVPENVFYDKDSSSRGGFGSTGKW